jgi:hypothetical protein
MVSFRSTGTIRVIGVIAGGIALTFTVLPLVANPQGSASPPAIGRWTSGEYVEAIFAVHNGAITLPRRGNPKTEAYFDRLIDRSNIESLMTGPLAEAEKRRQILTILSATGEFRGRYGYAVTLGDDVENELIQIQIFRLYLIDRLAALDMPDGEAMKRGTSAIATTLQGTLDTLSERPVFTPNQLVALAEALAEHYPMIRMRLAPEEYQAIDSRLERMALSERNPALKGAFAAALKPVQGSN